MIIKQLPGFILLISVLVSQAQNLSYIRALENQLDTIDVSREWRVLSELSIELASSDSLQSWSYYNLAFSDLQIKTSEKYYTALLAKGCLHEAQNVSDSAGLYLSQAVEVAKSLGQPALESRALEYLARVNLKEGKTHVSISQFKKGIELALEASDSVLLFEHWANIAYAYHTLSNYDSAIFFYLKGVAYCDSNPTYACAQLYNNMGITYQDKGELEKAEQYNYQSLKIRAEALDSLGVADSYINIAGTHWFREQIDSAAHYVYKAYEIYVERNHKRGQSLCLNNLGAIYNHQRLYTDAIDTYNKAIKLYKQSIDAENLAAAYANMAEPLIALDRFQLALYYLDSGIIIADRVGSKMILRETYNLKSQVYEKMGQINKAWEMRERYHDYKDSISNESNSRQVAELEAKFESEEKERMINEQDLQLSQQELVIQRNRWIIGSTIALSVLILVISLQQRNRMKLKANQRLADERKQLIERQIEAVVNSLELERRRFSEDLHDGFGQYISLIQRKVEQLNEIKSQKVKEDVYQESEKILKEMGRELKNICFNLMPKTLIQQGLDSALKEYLMRVNTNGAIACEYISHGFEGDERLEEVLEINLYRVCQEWTNNIMKYSDTKRIGVQLIKHDSQVNMTIEDDGAGFDSSVLESAGGNGWKNILSRINLMKGEVIIDTAIGRKGTTLLVDVPLKVKQGIQVVTEIT